MQSKVSQKEKCEFCILTCVYGTQKDGTDEFIFSVAMEKRTQRTDLWTRGGGEEGEGEREYGESNMETYIIICKIDSQWEFVV